MKEERKNKGGNTKKKWRRKKRRKKREMKEETKVRTTKRCGKKERERKLRMVFQQPWHGFVPGELVVSVLGCRSMVASWVLCSGF